MQWLLHVRCARLSTSRVRRMGGAVHREPKEEDFVLLTMGGVVSKAANGIGSVFGNVITAPFKSIFGGSCEGVCSGTWDVTCFIEHFCLSNLFKLIMVLGLCYIILLFFYLLFKVGICQCIGKSLCKMCWGACETYFYALEHIICFLWYKLKNTKRVNRRRRRLRNVEFAYSSSSDSDSFEGYSKSRFDRKRKAESEGRLEHLHRPLHSSKARGYASHGSRSHNLKFKPREVTRGSCRVSNSRQLQVRKVNDLRKASLVKRRRLR
ncbi:hypothetical protein RJ641_020339 [Dillenia turbinata]|uniref:Uncharacterized protein n=1 Tax=Dillenia turbinata TaxID=194707 RepID=A0AAN8UTK0_9MAGN